MLISRRNLLLAAPAIVLASRLDFVPRALPPSFGWQGMIDFRLSNLDNFRRRATASVPCLNAFSEIEIVGVSPESDGIYSVVEYDHAPADGGA